ncbi:MAG: CDP-alcohol phosphatidyltransferase family protein [Clostridia bacterium]|nr:CDP-alcohol phosphatidyltransferase family protein [Clostridia bacterium]MDD3971513.1 CDP-alcohol phosphatidyltransferase family protein [Clostridia bacterium]MDD4542403.1 CDP-alcohol phosphatidyltransferase family protein [Clostridia bacterium]NLF37706.1 phosphatidylglycerophosphate synthase [Clostridiaceae bacterium]
MKHIPNIITCIRLCLIPVFCYFLWNNNDLVAGIVFIIAALSDVVDGYLARKLNAISNFGKLADPFADKIMQISAIILLFLLGRLKAWIMIVLFAKDFILMLGGLLYKLIYNITVSSRWFGKISALTLNVIIAASILFSLGTGTTNILMVIAMCLQIASLVAYTVLSLINLSKIKNNKKEA